MTAIYTVTLVCNGDSLLSSGCPHGSTLVLETPSSGQARKEARVDYGWSTRWTPGTHRHNRKIADVCNVCDPQRRSTR